MKTFGALKNGDVVYTISEQYCEPKIIKLTITNFEKFSNKEVKFDIENIDRFGVLYGKTYIMRKNDRYGEVSPSLEGLEIYCRRELKRFFKEYKSNNTQ